MVTVLALHTLWLLYWLYTHYGYCTSITHYGYCTIITNQHITSLVEYCTSMQHQ